MLRGMPGPLAPDAPVCDLAACGRPAAYAFPRPAGRPAFRCRRHAPLYGPVLRQALRVAAVVGSVLFAINQADVVLRGDVTPLVVGKIGLTYLVPFSVSTYSALGVNRLRRPPPDRLRAGSDLDG
jgi:hypothetical protein